MNISGKVVIITGASEGIGRATAIAFAQAGAKLVLVARSGDKLQVLSEELRGHGYDVLAVPADVRDQAAVDKMIEQVFARFGRIDILINNAGQSTAGMVANINIDHFRQIMDLNVYGPVYAIQAVVPKMRQTGGGLIINISSMVTKMHLPGLGAYAATKSALNMLSETARVELAADNIRVLTVYPRTTATDFGKNALGDQQMRQRQRAQATNASYQVDTAEHVAKKILLAAEQEPAEQFMD